MLRPKWINYAEDLATKHRSYRKFFHAMNSDSTISTYSYSMKRFMSFLVSQRDLSHDEDYDAVAAFDSEKITDVLEDFVIMLGQTLKPNGINTHLSAAELFFEMNRKIWHKKLVRKSIKKDDDELYGKLPATNEDIIQMLETMRHPREKALIHFLASTGIRPSGITDPILRMKHLEYMPNPSNPNLEPKYCYAVKIYDESKEGYWVFLTPEATKSLNRYFGWRKYIRREEFTEETPIFANFKSNSKRPHLDNSGIRRIIETAIIRSGIERIKKGSRYDKAMNYMFRKRFNTILKLNNDVNSNIAEKLMAHKRGLDGTYLQPTRDECYREFVKAISQLTINPTERQKTELEEKQKKIDQLEATTRENSNLKQKLDAQEDRIGNLEQMLFDSNFHPLSKSD